MAEIRLSKLTKQFSIGLARLVDFLNEKGANVDMNPNAKISDEYLPLIEAKFGEDLKLKKDSEKVTAGEVSQKYTVISVDIDEADAINAFKTVLNEARDDKELKRVVEIIYKSKVDGGNPDEFYEPPYEFLFWFQIFESSLFLYFLPHASYSGTCHIRAAFP